MPEKIKMKKINILFTIASFLLVAANGFAQTGTPISADDFNACDGYIRDDNDQGNYAANMDETITICPGDDETVLNLYWTAFTVGAGDNMAIYDGPDTSYPLIGNYSGISLLNMDVTSTNPSGCLTLHFTSDGDDDTGDIVALISCGLPCAKPVSAIAIAGENTAEHVLICKDEELTFNAGGTTFQNDMVFQSVIWDFGDGTTNTTSWPTVNKVFDVPGAYKINVYVTDNNDCQSVNTLNVVIKVATEPEISVSSDDYLVCEGQEFTLSGAAEPVGWAANPQIDFGGALFLPDIVGQCFRDTLMVSNFDSDQTITSIDDLLGFGINMEHSYMGDLVVTFFCPDGGSIVVHNQGGGGTWLGQPCDQDNNPNQAGRPANYSWTPTSTNPIWSAANGAGLTTQLPDPCAGTNGPSLNPGDYAAVGDWNALIGCPLNGPWVVQVCDNLGSDNGFIFGWNVQFNPALYGEDLSFTPSIGIDCDSTFWAGPSIVDQGATCDTVTVVPSAAGNLTYTYTALDNHGCTYTETVNVQVYEGPVANAGDDIYFCGPQTALVGEVANPQPGIDYVYLWNNSGFLTNPNTASTNILADAFETTTEFVLSIYPTDDQNCLVHDTVLAIVPEYPPFASLDTIDVCTGELGIIYAPTPDPSDFLYEWVYSTDNVDFDTLDATTRELVVEASGYYMVYVYEPGCYFMSPSPYRVDIAPCEIRYPNIFTPNGDGDNDFFEIYGIKEFPGSTLIVYNRWGQAVFESKDYRNTWNGGDLADGTYYFIAEVKKSTGVEPMAGYFQLVRK